MKMNEDMKRARQLGFEAAKRGAIFWDNPFLPESYTDIRSKYADPREPFNFHTMIWWFEGWSQMSIMIANSLILQTDAERDAIVDADRIAKKIELKNVKPNVEM